MDYLSIQYMYRFISNAYSKLDEIIKRVKTQITFMMYFSKPKLSNYFNTNNGV